MGKQYTVVVAFTRDLVPNEEWILVEYLRRLAPTGLEVRRPQIGSPIRSATDFSRVMGQNGANAVLIESATFHADELTRVLEDVEMVKRGVSFYEYMDDGPEGPRLCEWILNGVGPTAVTRILGEMPTI